MSVRYVGHPANVRAAPTNRRADVQGLRAVAVVLVVAYHSDLGIPGGFVGVDMFFVVSGFVITGMFLRAMDSHDRISFLSFYVRRARRLLPALGAEGTILLVGDSNAGHFTEPMIAVARTLGMNLQVATSGGCPFLIRRAYSSPACGHLVEGDLRYILAQPTAYRAIVLSNADVEYVTNSRGNRTTAITTWVADLERTVSALRGRSPVVAVGAIPVFADIPNCLAPSLLDPHRQTGCGHLDRRNWLYRGELINAERNGLKQLAGGYVDTGNILCRSNSCDAYADGALVYRDPDHLSVSGSLLFEPRFLSALKPLVNH